ncbi:SusC/RagA family TonB-linked outer membrane protein [Pontibacter sp. BT731]|uniref:SusC/RagA family TonB-linked outer membrane protein n=1 Tax=Pontibacter coccineus TaxID=3063328 RepID=UPI0026E3E1F2|nr:SusC/RagA family TonB-linked outer membrane protein [Pontibacter sp. BT731]MDO6392112.1 SusC/RagA family TonB-linked outer membrane protein [Pontibacter sp. BT731]
MKKKLQCLLWGVFFLLFHFQSIAQGTAVSGTVTSAADKSALPGVSVVVKGKTRGTVTDISGKYTIEAAPSDVLVFSFIGMKRVERTVGNATTIDVMLQDDTKSLSEVVVTAFGVEQEKRALGYSVQEVQSREITETQQANIVNAMQGKVAGVQITNSGGAPGASAIMMIRGGTSLSGNNQPLYVVDGIPVDNSTAVSQGGLSAGTAPASNRAIDINPEDIESISVLKGPAAAALYGLRAAEGVVVITTKKGTAGKAKINYSNSFSFDKVNRLPTLQSEYMQGEQGAFDPASIGSWGPRFESGQTIYDNLESIFKTAFTQKHDVSVSGGTERSTFYGSASRFDQGGIVDNTNMERNSFRLSADTKVSDKLKVGGSANYIKSSRSYVPQGSASGVMGAVYWPRNDDMRNYLTPEGIQRNIAVNDNPHWSIQNKPITSDVDRVIAIGSVIYDPFEFLNVTYRLGTDYFTDDFKSVRMPGTTTVGEGKGALSQSTTSNQITTSTLLVTAKKTFANDFNTSLTLGNNAEDSRRQTTSWYGRNFIDPDFANINNVVQTDRTISQNVSQRRIVGAFADLNLDWKGIAFVNFRGRNDWSSTLPVKNRSFFYPSVSGSLVVTDLLEEMGATSGGDILSFGKIRASWARVGKDAPPHVLATTLATATNSFTIAPRGFISNANDYYGNPALRPEFTNSFEIGADVRFFRNRVGLDVTYYKTSTDDQILGTRTPPSSGSFLAYLNGGRIDNEGVEVMLNMQPVTNENFTWSVDFNIAKNKATVKELPGTLDRVELSDALVSGSVAQGAAFLGGSLFGINGNVWKRNDAGQLLLDNNGYPQVNSTNQYIGDRNPDWTGGITNTLTYKTFSFSFLWDIRVGGDIYNATENTLVRSGLSTKTLDRGQTRVFEGVIESTGEANTKEVVLDQNYYQTIYPFQGYDFVEDGSWLRLRYITLTYNLPTRMLGKTPISNLQVFGTGRNLLLFTNYSGVDPEVSGSGAGVGGSGSFGFDNLGIPATRGFDIGLRLTL